MRKLGGFLFIGFLLLILAAANGAFSDRSEIQARQGAERAEWLTSENAKIHQWSEKKAKEMMADPRWRELLGVCDGSKQWITPKGCWNSLDRAGN